MKYRGRQTIVKQILVAINRDSHPSRTRIMYGAFVSYAQVNEYLQYLLQNKVIEQAPLNHYKLTEKGLEVFHLLNRLDELLPAIGEGGVSQ